MIDNGNCAFCAASDAARRYECPPFKYKKIDGRLSLVADREAPPDAWRLCEPCARLIDAGDFDTLTDHAMAHVQDDHSGLLGEHRLAPEGADKYRDSGPMVRAYAEMFALHRSEPLS